MVDPFGTKFRRGYGYSHNSEDELELEIGFGELDHLDLEDWDMAVWVPEWAEPFDMIPEVEELFDPSFVDSHAHYNEISGGLLGDKEHDLLGLDAHMWEVDFREPGTAIGQNARSTYERASLDRYERVVEAEWDLAYDGLHDALEADIDRQWGVGLGDMRPLPLPSSGPSLLLVGDPCQDVEGAEKTELGFSIKMVEHGLDGDLVSTSVFTRSRLSLPSPVVGVVDEFDEVEMFDTDAIDDDEAGPSRLPYLPEASATGPSWVLSQAESLLRTIVDFVGVVVSAATGWVISFAHRWAVPVAEQSSRALVSLVTALGFAALFSLWLDRLLTNPLLLGASLLAGARYALIAWVSVWSMMVDPELEMDDPLVWVCVVLTAVLVCSVLLSSTVAACAALFLFKCAVRVKLLFFIQLALLTLNVIARASFGVTDPDQDTPGDSNVRYATTWGAGIIVFYAFCISIAIATASNAVGCYVMANESAPRLEWMQRRHEGQFGLSMTQCAAASKPSIEVGHNLNAEHGVITWSALATCFPATYYELRSSVRSLATAYTAEPASIQSSVVLAQRYKERVAIGSLLSPQLPIVPRGAMRYLDVLELAKAEPSSSFFRTDGYIKYVKYFKSKAEFESIFRRFELRQAQESLGQLEPDDVVSVGWLQGHDITHYYDAHSGLEFLGAVGGVSLPADSVWSSPLAHLDHCGFRVY